MGQYKHYLLAISFGLGLAYASIFIVGFGAAVAIPADIVKPLAQYSALLSSTLIDLVTIALPLAAAFLLCMVISSLVNKQPTNVFYVLQLVPLLGLHIYFMLQMPSLSKMGLIPTLPRYLLLGWCLYYVLRRNKGSKTAAL